MTAGERDPGAAAAAAQLAALRSDRAALADRVVQPWWWDVLLGLLFAGFVSSYSSRDLRVVAAALLLFLAGELGLVAWYRRATGVWFDARRVGPVQERVGRALPRWSAACLALLALGGAAEFWLGVRGAMVVVGVVLGTSVAVASRWVTRVYVAGLRAQP